MFKKSIYAFAIVASLTSACAQNSDTPPAPPKVDKDANASSAKTTTPQLSTLAKLSDQGDTNGDVRDRQVKVLNAQRVTYRDQLLTMQYYADQLFSTDTQVQQQALRAIATTTVGGAAVGSTVAVGGGILVGALTGNWVQSIIATAPAAAQMLTQGAAAEDAQKKADAAANTLSAQVKVQRDAILAQIANLQAKITAIDDQLAALNAQKL